MKLKLELLTSKMLAFRAPERWLEQYYSRNGNQWSRCHDDSSEKVWEALKLLRADPNGVDALLGNGSWTSTMCSSCEDHVREVLLIGDDGSAICRECFEAAGLLWPAKENPTCDAIRL